MTGTGFRQQSPSIEATRQSAGDPRIVAALLTVAATAEMAGAPEPLERRLKAAARAVLRALAALLAAESAIAAQQVKEAVDRAAAAAPESQGFPEYVIARASTAASRLTDAASAANLGDRPEHATSSDVVAEAVKSADSARRAISVAMKWAKMGGGGTNTAWEDAGRAVEQAVLAAGGAHRARALATGMPDASVRADITWWREWLAVNAASAATAPVAWSPPGDCDVLPGSSMSSATSPASLSDDLRAWIGLLIALVCTRADNPEALDAAEGPVGSAITATGAAVSQTYLDSASWASSEASAAIEAARIAIAGHSTQADHLAGIWTAAANAARSASWRVVAGPASAPARTGHRAANVTDAGARSERSNAAWPASPADGRSVPTMQARRDRQRRGNSIILSFGESVVIEPLRVIDLGDLADPAGRGTVYAGRHRAGSADAAEVHGAGCLVPAIRSLAASGLVPLLGDVTGPMVLPYVAPACGHARKPSAWVIPPTVLEALGLPGPGPGQSRGALARHVPDGLGIAYIPRAELPPKLARAIPPCGGAFLLLPGAGQSLAAARSIQIASIELGVGIAPGGATGFTVLCADARIRIVLPPAPSGPPAHAGPAAPSGGAAPAATRRPRRRELSFLHAAIASAALGVPALGILALLSAIFPIEYVAAALAGLGFTAAFRDAAGREVKRWARVSVVALVYMLIMYAILAAIFGLAALHVLPGPLLILLGVPGAFIAVSVLCAFQISVIVLPLMSVIWLLSQVATALLSIWLWCSLVLARGLILLASVLAWPFGGRAARAIGSAAHALPIVAARVRHTAARYKARGRLVRIRRGNAHHSHPHWG